MEGEDCRWSCAQCTFLNSEHRVTCEVCQAPSQSTAAGNLTQPEACVPAPMQGGMSGGWHCNECTFMNSASRNTCEMCAAGRPGASSFDHPVSSHSDQEWSCTQCSFFNTRTQFSCETCRALRSEPVRPERAPGAISSAYAQESESRLTALQAELDERSSELTAKKAAYEMDAAEKRSGKMDQSPSAQVDHSWSVPAAESSAQLTPQDDSVDSLSPEDANQRMLELIIEAFDRRTSAGRLHEVLQPLVAAGASVQASMAIHCCAAHNNGTFLDILVELSGGAEAAGVNEFDPNGSTPLMIAAEAAVAAGYSPSSLDSTPNEWLALVTGSATPARTACSAKLIELGANRSLKDSEGITAVGRLWRGACAAEHQIKQVQQSLGLSAAPRRFDYKPLERLLIADTGATDEDQNVWNEDYDTVLEENYDCEWKPEAEVPIDERVLDAANELFTKSQVQVNRIQQKYVEEPSDDDEDRFAPL